MDKRIELFQSLPEDIQELLKQERYQIRYSKKYNPIHSKLYLMDGLKDTRVMVGSANFTDTAFSQRKQFEELLVFDNSPLFDIYSQRFQDIYRHTVDYIPEKIKQKLICDPVNIADPNQMDVTYMF
nr:phospholipase D family protein [uncultured Bacillus sp.]